MMEISLLKLLLKNISSFFCLSSHETINREPALKYYRKTEQFLKLLKTALDAICNGDIFSEDSLQKAIVRLGHSVDELREIFESWHPLKSRISFVLQCESLIAKAQASGLEIFELLEASAWSELNMSPVKIYLRKIKQMGLEHTSAIVDQAIWELEKGSGPTNESLSKFMDHLSIRSNQELLIEAVALEKLKENAEQAEKSNEAKYLDRIIAILTQLHEGVVFARQSRSSNPLPIPADFCCPLSLELMTDPVIVASGQTYERDSIGRWIGLGLIVCPKTRQALVHTNLIPNYTVKALIANWCESNNIKLRESGSSQPLSPKSTGPMGSPGKYLLYPEATSPSGSEIGRSSLNSLGDQLINPGEQGQEFRSQSLSSLSTKHSSADGVNGQISEGHIQSTSDSSAILTPHTSCVLLGDGFGELTSMSQGTNASITPQRDPEPESSPRIGMRKQNPVLCHHPSDRFVPRLISSPTVEVRADLLELETQVKKLVKELKSTLLDSQRDATTELRLLSKHNMDNRIVIANCGTITFLVNLLHSTDLKVQENAVTTILNLSINDNNKIAITNAEVFEPLIHVLQNGTPEAKENSAATLFSLSFIRENRVRIGRSGAIKPLVDLLGSGTPRGKKDAATALFNLSICHENKARIVQAGAVKYLVELMDPAGGMVDKAVAVLANISTIQEGRAAIGQEGGIPVLVEVVELGSARGKENAAVALLRLCTNSSRYCNMVLQEGAIPPLVALSQSGTPRAKEKAQALLSYFRNQKHNKCGRS